MTALFSAFNVTGLFQVSIGLLELIQMGIVLPNSFNNRAQDPALNLHEFVENTKSSTRMQQAILSYGKQHKITKDTIIRDGSKVEFGDLARNLIADYNQKLLVAPTTAVTTKNLDKVELVLSISKLTDLKKS